MITSTGNGKVKQVINLMKEAKERRESGLFIAEGLRICREIPRERIDSVYVSQTFLKEEGNRRLAEQLSAYEVSDGVFKAMSDTQTPQGILAVVRQYTYKVEDLLKNGEPPLLMILETLQDPGNLGTIIRAGEGAGVTGILMNDSCADIYSPKVIRSTMGSVYRMPFAIVPDLKEALLQLKKKGVSLYAAHLSGQNNYEAEDYRKSTGFLIGNEGNGLTEETASLADAYIKIPMKGHVESLNAAVAASVLMFEAARQRGN